MALSLSAPGPSPSQRRHGCGTFHGPWRGPERRGRASWEGGHTSRWLYWQHGRSL